MQGSTSFDMQCESKKRNGLLAMLFALLLLVATGANAQSDTTVKAPPPLAALGMSYANLRLYLGPCDNECKPRAKEAELGHHVVFELPPYTYTVEAGKVVEVMITADSFDGFVGEGYDMWGPPTTLVHQNLESTFGAEASTSVARWELPGGVIVEARPAKIPGKIIGVTTVTTNDHKTIHITQQEDPVNGAIVIINNPGALGQKHKNVLGGPDKGSVVSTIQSSKPRPQ
jgi:hypothetical protein